MDREFSSVEEVTARIKEIDKEIETARDRIDVIREWLQPYESQVIHGRLELQRLRSVRSRMSKEMEK